jgi:HEAT repeat protein
MSIRFALLLLAFVFESTRLPADDVFDSIMYRDPVIPPPTAKKTFPDGLLELWLQALERPEADLQTQAALTITSAHQRGMAGLSKAIPQLQTAFERAKHAHVRHAIAHTLIALDAKTSAEMLFKQSLADPDLREIADPALAKWDYLPARAAWLERLNQPAPYNRNHLRSMQALAQVKDSSAVPKLRELLFAHDVPDAVRLDIAHALGNIQSTGNEADARKLTADPTSAALLLRNHSSDESVKLLQDLVRSSMPTAATIAVRRLNELNPDHVLPLVETVLASADPAVRRAGVETLFRRPTAERIPLLSERLNDPHPDVRTYARQCLNELAAKPEFKTVVLDRLTFFLNGSDWRGQEQAAFLAGQLNHRPSSTRLVELLPAKRPEAFIAAAWALRVLAVPETLPPILTHVQMRHRQIGANGYNAGLENVSGPELDQHLSQLLQFFGQANYKPANATLRAIFPRFVSGTGQPGFTRVGGEARAAAIWSLGKLHANDPEKQLVEQIEERLTGDPGMGSDDPRVRRMAALALVRMKAVNSLPALRGIGGEDPIPTLDMVIITCRWADEEMSGRPHVPPAVVLQPQRDWFLKPNR